MTKEANLIQDARQFLGALAQNNTRDWWQDNKATYDKKLKQPALELLDDMSPIIANIAEAPVKPKLFRPHRDVRFSKDKTPYTTHLHMMWAIEAGARQNPVFFFGVGLDYVTAGAGIMGFDKTILADWRKFADLDTDRILRLFSQLGDAGVTFREPELKRVPPPFDKEHAGADLLRRKGLVAQTGMPDGAPLSSALTDAFQTLWPVNALMLQVAEA